MHSSIWFFIAQQFQVSGKTNKFDSEVKKMKKQDNPIASTSRTQFEDIDDEHESSSSEIVGILVFCFSNLNCLGSVIGNFWTFFPFII